ncbi:hypothetical protein TI39_contig455g00015 [Zymoseptoria brevis]|uniref:Uncharacterized protein n=1 Tax=Zymoseptoria brevis TaxID=1047168 RepID=A0A0F4GNT2_9PEZI|nr:hypothetical protein TI39_contig455g00015 [Zymoseptoria brevis]
MGNPAAIARAERCMVRYDHAYDAVVDMRILVDQDHQVLNTTSQAWAAELGLLETAIEVFRSSDDGIRSTTRDSLIALATRFNQLENTMAVLNNRWEIRVALLEGLEAELDVATVRMEYFMNLAGGDDGGNDDAQFDPDLQDEE